MKFKDLTWPQAAVLIGIVVSILASVIVLTIYNKDTTGVLLFGGTILAGLGIGGLAAGQTAIKENVNGNWSKMMAVIEKQSDQLARSQPVAVAVAPEEPAPDAGNTGP